MLELVEPPDDLADAPVDGHLADAPAVEPVRRPRKRSRPIQSAAIPETFFMLTVDNGEHMIHGVMTVTGTPGIASVNVARNRESLSDQLSKHGLL
jgi:hypothetical protein